MHTHTRVRMSDTPLQPHTPTLTQTHTQMHPYVHKQTHTHRHTHRGRPSEALLAVLCVLLGPGGSVLQSEVEAGIARPQVGPRSAVIQLLPHQTQQAAHWGAWVLEPEPRFI